MCSEALASLPFSRLGGIRLKGEAKPPEDQWSIGLSVFIEGPDPGRSESSKNRSVFCTLYLFSPEMRDFYPKVTLSNSHYL